MQSLGEAAGGLQFLHPQPLTLALDKVIKPIKTHGTCTLPNAYKMHSVVTYFTAASTNFYL